MKLTVKEKLNRLNDYLYYESEKIFKSWYIVSWIILIVGYSLSIVAYTLFGYPPVWLVILSGLGIIGTFINFFIAVLLAIFYVIRTAVKKEITKSRIVLLLSYATVSLLFYFASTI